MQNPTSYIFPILLIALAIFMRVRRAVSFQRYNPVTPVIRIVLFVIVIALILYFGISYHPSTLIPDTVGLVIGVGLGFLGARHAQFEIRKDGLYFKTHIWIEIGILALFFVRLAMRFYMFYSTLGNTPPELAASQLRYEKDPVTGFIIGIVGAYYICYYAFIMAQANRQAKSQIPNK